MEKPSRLTPHYQLFRKEAIPLTPFKEIDRVLALLLVEQLQSHQETITYKEVAQKLSNRLGRPIHPHFDLASPLGKISTLCYELGLPLISACVIHSKPTKLHPSEDGFYSIACMLKPEYKAIDPATVRSHELAYIHGCHDWSKLLNYLENASSTGDRFFSDWMSQNTVLSKSSISKYSRAVNTISKEMQQKGIITKPFEDMTLFELDNAISLTMGNPDFIAKNTRGNHMYSNALKHYRYFMSSASDETGDSSYVESLLNDDQIPETERKAIIQARVGQGIFRKSLFEKYHGHCIITGIDHPKLLVASHIKPWAVCSNRERLSVENGLLLSATYDRLFDSGLITFNRNGKIFLSSFIGTENINRLGLSKDMSFELGVTGKMGEYLDYHNDILFVK